MTAAETTSIDGRRARRDRNRAAVIDALLDLLVAHDGIPPTEAIAERAGVSVSSIFRYFDGIDDLQRQAVEQHVARTGHLFRLPDPGVGPLDERIGRFVGARLAMHEGVRPVARIARSRALDHPVLAERLASLRDELRRQTAEHFAEELGAMTRNDADDIIDVVDALTSFESWELLHDHAGRSSERIERSWIHAIRTLVAPAT